MDTEGQTPLSQLLSDEPNEAPAIETPDPVADPEQSGQPRDENGRFARKGEEGASPAPVEEQEEPPYEHAAVKGERNRRQAAETERDTLRSELDALKQQFQQLQQPAPAPPPSLWDDEQGWQQHFGQQVAQFTSMNAKLDMSEMLASQTHEDFDEMKESFVRMAEQNPALAQQALAAKHPWEKAYQIARNAATMAELGATDLDTLKAKLREEILAEQQQGQTPVPQQTQLPPSLTGERNVGARSGPAWAGPTPLNQLLA